MESNTQKTKQQDYDFLKLIRLSGGKKFEWETGDLKQTGKPQTAGKKENVD